jgi:hypothetical protein
MAGFGAFSGCKLKREAMGLLPVCIFISSAEKNRCVLHKSGAKVRGWVSTVELQTAKTLSI